MSVSPHRMSRRAHPLLVPGRDRTSVECANQDLMKPKLVITFTMQRQQAWYRPKSSAPRENVWDKQSGIWEGSFAQWKRLWSHWNNFSILHHFLALLLTSWNVTEIMLANSLVSLHCDGQIHAIWHHSSNGTKYNSYASSGNSMWSLTAYFLVSLRKMICYFKQTAYSKPFLVRLALKNSIKNFLNVFGSQSKYTISKLKRSSISSTKYSQKIPKLTTYGQRKQTIHAWFR